MELERQGPPQRRTEEERGDMSTAQQRNDIDAIMRKARALINVAEHPNTSPEEAAAAAGRLQALMTRYNLDLAALEVEGAAGEGPAGYIAEEYDLNAVRAGNTAWRMRLMAYICQYNFCRIVTSKRSALNSKDLDEHWLRMAEAGELEEGLPPKRKRGGASKRGIPTVTIVGQTHNVELVKYLYEYLARDLARIARERHEIAERNAVLIRRIGGKALTVPEWRRWLNSFGLGAADIIGHRLKEQYAADVAATEPAHAPGGATVTGMELVVIKGAELSEAMTRLVGEVPTAKMDAPDSPDERAYKAGVQAGAGMNLNRPLEERRKGATMLPAGE